MQSQDTNKLTKFPCHCPPSLLAFSF